MFFSEYFQTFKRLCTHNHNIVFLVQLWINFMDRWEKYIEPQKKQCIFQVQNVEMDIRTCLNNIFKLYLQFFWISQELSLWESNCWINIFSLFIVGSVPMIIFVCNLWIFKKFLPDQKPRIFTITYAHKRFSVQHYACLYRYCLHL